MGKPSGGKGRASISNRGRISIDIDARAKGLRKSYLGLGIRSLKSNALTQAREEDGSLDITKRKGALIVL